MIYHYCGKEVFEKIIETEIIWLSDITKTNDKGEYNDGFQIIHDILKIYPNVDKKIATEMSPSNINNTFKVLISCFSYDGDVLSQWRAYADDGCGFSIGFDMELIEQHHLFNRYLEKMEVISGKISFISVNYDRSEFEREVHQLVKKCIDSSSPISFKLLSRELMYMAIMYKDNFFKEEQEVRGFIAPEESIKGDDYMIEQRDCSYGAANFHRLNTSFQDIHAIKEVVIGPKNSATIEETKNKLKNFGLENIPVRISVGYGKYR